MLNLIAYLRVSTPEQRKKYGFDTQLRDVQSYCQTNKIKIVETLRDDYSGMIPLFERPEGRRVTDLLKSGKASGVIFPKVNRLGRSFAEMPITVKQIIKAGYRVYSVDIGEIPSELDFNFVFHALESQRDHDRIIEQTSGGRLSKAMRHQWVGAGGAWGVPYGFRTVGAGKEIRVVIDKQRAHVVEAIYKQYAIEGVPTRRIAEALNKKGVSPARSNQWTKGMVWNILANDWYLGRVRYGEIAFTDPSLAIITPDLWRRAEARRTENRKHAPKDYGVDYLLSRGRLICTCGSTMCGVSSGGGKHRYYLCWKHTEFNGGDSRRCELGRLRQADVEATAIYWLMSLAIYEDKMRRVIREMEEKAQRELEPLKQRRDSINEMVGDTSTQITRLIRRSAEEPDDQIAKSYQNEIHRLSDLSKGLSDQLSEVESEIADYGLWAQGGVTPEQLQAELRDVWDFQPSTSGKPVSMFSYNTMNRAKMRKVIERYDLRAEVVSREELRVSCALQPKGETIGMLRHAESTHVITPDLRKLTTGTCGCS